MSALSDLRAEVAEDLAATGLPVTDYVPERLNPPLVLLEEGTPYVTRVTQCIYSVNLVVRIVARKAESDNAENMDLLNETIEKVLIATDATEVSPPEILQANNANYLSARVTLSADIDIN